MEIGPILLEHDRKVKDGLCLCLASVTVPDGPPPPSGDGEAWRPIGLVIIFLNYSFLLQYFETTRTHQCAPWCYYLETHQKETLYVTVVSECLLLSIPFVLQMKHNKTSCLSVWCTAVVYCQRKSLTGLLEALPLKPTTFCQLPYLSDSDGSASR